MKVHVREVTKGAISQPLGQLGACLTSTQGRWGGKAISSHTRHVPPHDPLRLTPG